MKAGLIRFAGLPHGFAGGSTTRLLAPDDLPVDAALRRLAAALGAPDVEVVRGKQVHGRNVLVTESEPAPGATLVLGEADAVMTDRPGRMAAVVSADCVPIVLADPESGWIAAVHAGWRGTAVRILDTVLDLLAARGVPAGRLSAAFGPSISRDRYEVGPEVVTALRTAYGDVPDAIRPGNGDRSFVDVAAFDRALLAARGVTAIATSSDCTASDPERFPSYRRDGARAGRIVTGIVRLG